MTIRGIASVSEAFDSNILISAVTAGPLADACLAAIRGASHPIGSVVLLPEVLTKPLRADNETELSDLIPILSTFDLKPVDEEIADASVTMGAKYGLKAADAIHLATAVVWGAARFHTNNRKDFGPHITEIDVVSPESA